MHPTSTLALYPDDTTESIRVTVDRDELYEALRKVEPLLGDRPERRYLRVDTTAGQLALSTTDSDQLITARLAGDVTGSGSVIAYGRFFAEFVHRAPEGKVVLIVVDGELQIEAGGSQIGLACFPIQLWPHLEHLTGSGVTWPSATLRRLSRILHAVSKDDGRPALQGVCLRDGWAAATDSFRLAAVQLDLVDGADAVIPGSTLENVLRIGADSDVAVFFADKKVTFAFETVSITTTLIVEPFPAWQNYVPKPQGRIIRTDRSVLLGALERMAFLALKEIRCSIRIRSELGGLRLEAKLPDIGHQEDRISGENNVGDVCLQLRHLKDLLEQLAGSEAIFDMGGPLLPAVTREQGFLGLLMPIKT